MLKRYFLLVTLLLSAHGFATEYKPWFGVDFSLCTKVSELFQYYRTVNADSRSLTYTSDDNFITGSVSTTLFGNWSVEAETTFAFTRRQSKSCDNFRITGRTLLLDDVIGDPVSLVAGVTLSHAFKHSVHDLSSFHHGIYEGELHLSVGKETTQSYTWCQRWWGMIAFGSAEKGNPWGRLQLQYEKNYADCANLYAFAHFLYGFGDKNIRSVCDFKGYGSVKHRSFDLGCGATKQFNCDWDISLQLMYRAYAHNFPANAFCAKLTVEYPFFF